MRLSIQSWVVLLVCVGILPGITATASAAETLVRAQCVACHQLEQAGSPDLDPAERALRLAPPLYYAGNKYRQDWLARWLADPARLWPAGYFSPAHTVTGPDGDTVDKTSLHEHLRLSARDAEEVAAYLMSLRGKDDLAAEVDYEPATVAMRMGQLDFRRFKGCNACHQDEEGTGGLSGPELYTAWERLNPDYLVSYIADPTRWERTALMPVFELNQPAVHKLVDYLHTISKE